MAVEAAKTVKEELHQLIELLPEAEASDALDYVRWLRSNEEELTEEELADVLLGEAEIARGDFVTLEELKRDVAR